MRIALQQWGSTLTTEPLMTEREAAEFLGIAPATLRRWRLVGQPPQYVKLSRAVRYRRADLTDFIEGNLCTSTSAGVRESTGGANG